LGAAWIQVAEGKEQAAVATLLAAADRDNATDTDPVTPGPLASATASPATDRRLGKL
jgi:hypothetical protein